MRPGIRQQNGKPVPQQQLRITQHSHPVIRHPMQQNHRIAIAVRRPQTPPAQRHPVLRGHRNVCQFCIAPRRHRLRTRLVRPPQNAPPRMRRPFPGNNANHHADHQPDRNRLQTQSKKNVPMSHEMNVRCLWPQRSITAISGQSHESLLLTRLVPMPIAPEAQRSLAPRFSAGRAANNSSSAPSGRCKQRNSYRINVLAIDLPRSATQTPSQIPLCYDFTQRSQNPLSPGNQQHSARNSPNHPNFAQENSHRGNP